MDEKKSDCPVCNESYNPDKADLICARHDHWIVTICEECNQPTISNQRGGCIPCVGEGEPGRPEIWIFKSRDRRAYLRNIGQAGVDDWGT